jgi:hypothetical protein
MLSSCVPIASFHSFLLWFCFDIMPIRPSTGIVTQGERVWTWTVIKKLHMNLLCCLLLLKDFYAARCNNMSPSSTTACDPILPRRSEYRYKQEDGSDGEASRDSLAYVQLEACNVDPKSLYKLQDSQKEYRSRIVRTQIFSKVKFLPKSGKEHEMLVWGSFWKPDLLENTPGYIDAILDNYSSDLKRRRERKMSIS